MKSNKPEGVWKTLRIAIILLVANIMLVTNLYIYSMYISNQSMEMSMNAQSIFDTVSSKKPALNALKLGLSINQVVRYDLPSDYLVSAKSITWPLNAEAIKNRISECDSKVTKSQITSTVDSYKGIKGVEYTFTKQGLDGAYTVTVFPNKRFSTIEEAQRILNVCPTGGQMLPKTVNQSAILFTDSCGNGAESENCESIRTTIEPSLSIE
jgi:hypothetical protein